MTPLNIDGIIEYLDKDKTDWIVTQGERQLEYLHDAGAEVNKKAQSLLNVGIVLLTGLVAYAVGHIDAQQGLLLNLINTGSIWVACGFIVAAGMPLLQNVRTDNFTRLGSRPANLLHPEFVVHDVDVMKRGYLIEIDRRIGRDEEMHELRCDRLDRAVLLLGLAPVAAAASEVAILFGRWLWPVLF